MKKIKRLIEVLLCGSLVFSLAGCDMIQKTPDAKKKSVVATVDGEKITLSDVDKLLGSVISQIKQQYGQDLSANAEGKKALVDQRTNALNSILEQKVCAKKAVTLKLMPTDADLNKQIDDKLKQIKEMYENDDAKFKEALKAENMTEDQLKKAIKDSIVTTIVKQNVVKDIKVTDEEVQKYYDTHKETEFSKGAGADMYHILVATEDEAKKIKKELDGGAKFADEAAKYGTDGTKTTGGSLGFVEYEAANMDKDFLAGAKKLKEGEISNPVKSQYGFHIIMVKNIKTDKHYQPLADVKDKIASTLKDSKSTALWNTTFSSWKTEYKVTIKNDNLGILY